MKNKKFKELLYSIGSILGLAAINYSILHNIAVFVVLLILLAHELGHYFVAKANDGKPSYPIFIPLPFIAIAMVKVSKMSNEGIKKTAMSGPFAGFMTAVLFLIFNNIFMFMSNIPLIIIMFAEVFTNMFGSDGKKYRMAKRNEILCSC